MRTVLDTSVLIDRTENAIEGELAISAASLAELHFGVLVTDDPALRAVRLRFLVDVMGNFDALPMDEVVAASYGMLAAATISSGRQPRARQFDLVIAATAHAHDARLATANFADFAHLTDLIDVVDTNTRQGHH